MRERPRPKSEERAKAGSVPSIRIPAFPVLTSAKRTPANRRKRSISVTKADCRIVSKSPPGVDFRELKQRNPVTVYSAELRVLR